MIGESFCEIIFTYMQDVLVQEMVYKNKNIKSSITHKILKEFWKYLFLHLTNSHNIWQKKENKYLRVAVLGRHIRECGGAGA